MSVFGPNQVEELIIGNAKGTAADVPAFIASAADREVQLLSKDGSALALNKDFYVLQKTDGNALRNLNYEFSDGINPRSINGVSAVAYSPEVAKMVRVEGFAGNVIQNATYEVFVRIYNDGGTLSTENFRFLYGNFVTGASFAGTDEDIVDGIIDSLNKAVSKSYSDMGSFTFTKSAAPLGIEIEGVIQDNKLGKITGRPIEFDIQVAVKDNCNALNCSTPAVYNFLEVNVVERGTPGVGTGKIVTNLEWFTKGYKYEPYRETGYPANFDSPYYASKGETYNMIHINYFKERAYTNVEKQHRVLTIAIAEAPGVFTQTNLVLADIRTATGLSLAELPDLA